MFIPWLVTFLYSKQARGLDLNLSTSFLMASFPAQKLVELAIWHSPSLTVWTFTRFLSLEAFIDRVNTSKGDNSDFYAFRFRFWTLWIINTLRVTSLLVWEARFFSITVYFKRQSLYEQRRADNLLGTYAVNFFFVSVVMSNLVAFLFTCSIVWVISISALTRSAALGSYWEMTREQPTRVYIVSRERRFGCFEDATQLPSFLSF